MLNYVNKCFRNTDYDISKDFGGGESMSISIMNFTPFPNLTTEHLNLRQIKIKDLKEFFILKSDERLLKNYDAKAKTYEEARQFLHKLNTEVSRNECIVWGISLKDDNKLIGSICFWNISKEQSKAEIGYELMFDLQGKGLMQEAIKVVIKYGFYNMKLQLIEGILNPNHSKSVKLLERNDFTIGTNLRQTDPYNGNILPRVIYSLRNKNL